MPFPYYSMPFCQPPEGVKKSSSTVNPGTILLGIRIENSPYTFSVMVRGSGMARAGAHVASSCPCDSARFFCNDEGGSGSRMSCWKASSSHGAAAGPVGWRRQAGAEWRVPTGGLNPYSVAAAGGEAERGGVQGTQVC